MSLKHAEDLLQSHFGFSSFRLGQRQIVESILNGHHTLGIMPTGGGKSICYQIPALMLPGVTIVISPLISLMKDQVDGLQQIGIPATFINSSLTSQEIHQRIQETVDGKYKLLYLAPERIDSEHFQGIFERLPVYLVTIDEAHCISQWGHDFRPSYRSMVQKIRQLPRKPIIASLTATATPAVKEDIAHLLGISDHHIFTSKLQRANLSFSVQHEVDKATFIESYLRSHPGQTGIIYCSTRKDVEKIHEFLVHKGFSAAAYHAGLSDQDRIRAQEQFSYDQIQTIVATNAFGMGIDKSNVRFVIHFNLPKNLESYYQEAGRAGRDGDESECILLYSPEDIQTPRFLIQQSELPPDLKKLEFHKLQEMKNYCYTQQCLQKTIVQYFGDDHDFSCGKCSNCLQLDQERTEIDATVDAQKIFSCIKRMKERFGLTTVVKVLRGSNSKRLLQWKLDQLSTYGIMKDKSEKEILALSQWLAAEGYIAIVLSDQSRPLATLTAKAVEVLKGERRVTYQQRSVLESLPTTSKINELFEELRLVRRTLSEQEQLPPYMIFQDSTLKEMSRKLPVDSHSFLQITGVGEKKYQKYGDAFIQVIRTYVENHQLQPVHELSTTPTTNDKEPSHLTTFHMYEEGKSIEEIAEVRSLHRATIEDHLFRCGMEGFAINWDLFIPKEYEALIIQKIEALGAHKLRPLKEELPDEVDYMAIKAVIAKRELVTSN
ncbi:DNA helicase RecQ [Hazenella coriacea]|uniref:DNA helicase RecQ n=1 Tax=Hazenella coriacea TaxID=1179467 RepID=A0A4R3LAI4_9BACL|nr:DNA helicase RecQ [Hazenella coriacea]TCS96863.1 RecQ-like ATP-dependent DNA helicase [Hazenella coriacea]